jgi:hypothetical protein
LKSQIPSTPPKKRRAGKFQINSKSQASNFKHHAKGRQESQIPNRFKAIVFLFGILNFGQPTSP